MPKIYPCLWFNDEAEHAAKYYVSVFKNSRIISVARYGEAASQASGKPKGSVMTVAFELEGQEFLALNGGPQFPLTPAVSLVASCKTQKEMDGRWKKLSADPAAERCGWLKDKFGVSWQIVPSILAKMAASKDAKKADRVMQAVIRMKNLDLKTLEEAFSRP
ncbi:MAG: VOC family protein [Elusimicrobiota bacterium]